MEKKKQCSKCKEWKILDDFHKSKYGKNGRRGECKKCGKKYYIKNKERISKKGKEHHRKNKEKISKIKKEYRNSFVLWDSSFPNKLKLYEEVRQNNGYLEVKCTYCGMWFIPKVEWVISRIRTINGNMNGESRLYCSDNCKKECPIFHKQKWPKGHKKATSREVQPELRQMVLLRDNYTCQKCNLTQDELETGLHCHHYEGILYNPIESADIDNCVTLCKNCHKEIHKLPGCSYDDMKCNK